MNLDVVITAMARGTEAFVQLSGALLGVKAEAESTAASLDDVKVHSGAASEAANVLGASTVDVAARMKEARARADELKNSLLASGVGATEAEKAARALGDTLAKRLITTDLITSLRDTGESMKVIGPAARTAAAGMVDAASAAEQAATAAETASSPSALGNLPQIFSSISSAVTPLGGAVMPVLIGMIVAAAVALGPLIFALGAWLVATTALTVGMAGFVAVLGIAAGAVGILTFGVIALGLAQVGGLNAAQNLTTAQAAATSAQTAAASAAQAHENAIWSLQQAEAAVAATRQPTAALLHSITLAQQQVTSAAQAHENAIWTLQQAEAAAAATRQPTAAQLHAITLAQQQVATTAQAHENAIWTLQQAEKAEAAARQPTAAQLHAISQAQQQVATTSAALATANNNVTKTQNDLATAQKNATSPVAVMVQHFKDMGNELGQRSVPLLFQMAEAADKLVAPLQKAGDDLLKWFGPELPKILQGASSAFLDLLGAARLLGPSIAQVIDYVVANAPLFDDFFHMFLNFGVDSIKGLIENLLRLSDWFTNNWSSLYPIAAQGFDLLGQAIQGIGPVAQAILNWISDHWPEIVDLAHLSAQAFGEVVAASGFLLQALQVLAPFFKYLADHSKETSLVLAVMMGILPILAATFVAVALVVVWLIQQLVALVVWIEDTSKWLGENLPKALQWAGDRFSDLGKTAHDVTSWIGQGFSDLGSAVHTAINWIGQRFSDLGTMAHNLKDGIGSIFSGLGSAIHGGLKDVLAAIGHFDDAVDSIPIIGGILALPKSSALPQFAQGGIVDRPTLGVFGEAGPEALIPVGAGAGPRAIELWQKAGQMLGLGAGAVDTTPGDWGGQCVVFVENFTGHHFDVAMASQMAAFVNSQTPAPGEIFVSTAGVYGHTGMVIGNGKVLDSNWGLDERIQIHNLSDISGIAGYISGVAGASLPGGILDVSGALAPLVTRVTSGMGGWTGQLATGLLNSLAKGLGQKYDTGGPLMPGATLAVNNTGRPESVLGSRAEELLASIDRRLAATSVGPERVDDTNDLLVQLYNLLAERLPSGSKTAFSTRAYSPAT